MDKIKEIKFSDIRLSKRMLMSTPKIEKFTECMTYYNINGKLDRDIIISPDGLLLDGYIGYLVLKENGFIDELIKVIEKTSCKSNGITYVYGRHPGVDKEYVWKIVNTTKFIHHLKIGNFAKVRTKHGDAFIIITRFNKSLNPPRKGTIKSVIACYDSDDMEIKRG